MTNRRSLPTSLSAAIAPVLSASLVFLVACGADNRNSQPAASNSNAPATSSPSAAGSPATAAIASGKRVNLNTATREEFFAAIPNLGNKMAHEFEEYRPYQSIQQFRKEIGKYVDQAKVAEYEKSVYVPIDPNQSDGPTLQQIPGLDEAEAQALIKERPYASQQAFLEKLKGSISAADLDLAKSMLTSQ
jgi:DNA uptake protein ComE-like DNA-binding protein